MKRTTSKHPVTVTETNLPTPATPAAPSFAKRERLLDSLRLHL